MAVTPVNFLNKDGLKTLVNSIFEIVNKNFLKRTELKNEMLKENSKYHLYIKAEDGCLYLQLPEDADPEIADQVVKEWKKQELLNAVQGAIDKVGSGSHE